MECIEDLLRGFCVDAERALKPSLRGFKALVLRPYLPQIWTFETESETVNVLADTDGGVSISHADNLQRDVTIAWEHSLMCEVLSMRSGTSIPEGERPTITYHTAKGRAAFEFLKGRLGL